MKLRARHYYITQTHGPKARSYGFQFWSDPDSISRKWVLDIWFHKHLWAVWVSKEG
jgi:hypothetical protein